MVERNGTNEVIIKTDMSTSKLAKDMKNISMWDKVHYMVNRPLFYCVLNIDNCVLTVGLDEIVTLTEGVAKCDTTVAYKYEYGTSISKVVSVEE